MWMDPMYPRTLSNSTAYKENASSSQDNQYAIVFLYFVVGVVYPTCNFPHHTCTCIHTKFGCTSIVIMGGLSELQILTCSSRSYGL